MKYKSALTRIDATSDRCGCLLCRVLEAGQQSSRAVTFARRRLKRATAVVLDLVAHAQAQAHAHEARGDGRRL